MNNLSDVLTLERCEVECMHPEHVAPLLGRILDYAAADRVASTFAVLADPTRARILHALDTQARTHPPRGWAWLEHPDRAGRAGRFRWRG